MSQVLEISAEQFSEEVINYQGKVLVDFYAQWCGPCKMISPVIEQIAKENNDLKVIKIDADHAQELMTRYSIRGIPTLLLLEDGELKDQNVGAASINQLNDFIQV